MHWMNNKMKERNALWNILCKFGCVLYKLSEPNQKKKKKTQLQNNQLITIIIAAESTNPTNKEINNKQTAITIRNNS